MDNRRRQQNRRDWSKVSNDTLAARAKQLLTAPDIPSRSYGAAARQFERLAKNFGWVDAKGAVYPVRLSTLQLYIAYQEARIKPQSLLSYLAALRDKHEQLGFLDWGKVRFNPAITRMLRSNKRNFLHTESTRCTPITGEHLRLLKRRLDLARPRHALFWAVASIAFHAMARLGEILPADNSRIALSIRLQQLRVERADDGPYALITLPRSKVHDPNVEATLAVWRNGSSICPWEALRSYLRFRLRKDYAIGSPALWCIENGHAINKRWFLEALATYLPEYDFTGHSFRAGGATHWAKAGIPKWVIQRLGRWTSMAFETYIRTNPAVLVAFAKASCGKITAESRT